MKKSVEDKVRADCEQILDYKAQGWNDRAIRKVMSLSWEYYARRLKYIRRNRYFIEQAQQACIETIHRMMFTRAMALENHIKKRDSHPNAAAGYLKTVCAIDMAIPQIATQLNFLPLPSQEVAVSKRREQLVGMSPTDLADFYRGACERAKP